ncbi:serine/threonine-protein kinase [Streptomyces sp. NBC_00342]|uniref:serine/threonine-protein kinase n=1 Tax=Streptomyces sp. NBC_00342 TaxID=2975718 RepID=UPI002E2DFA58|nr:serine/threonine-protein kinase [Streptomyces sp. NBC_00342]
MRYGADGAGLPEHIGGYAVERELGAGGMGTVYLARSRGGRAVAVKVARPELASDPHFRERFRAEVAAARSVGGFHTAPVVDADPAAEAPWLATAYVPGPTLAGLLDAEGPMDEARLRLLGAALAEALEAIHRCGLVHRDLKPGNIIMASDGPRVLDFGIARALESPRLTATGMAFGTPGFLAPEQAQGQEVGPAADVFALGAVLVAAAGGSAFGAGTPMGMMYRSVHEQPDLTAVPDGLRPVVASCLAKSPDQRPTLGHLLDLIAPATARYSPTVAIPPPPSHAPSIPVPMYQAPAGYGNGYGYGGGGGAPPVDDPVFLAVAPDSALMVDGMGVTIDFRYRSLQFGWEEIRTVQYAPEGPKHLRVVVHLHDGTAHPCLLAARRRSRLKAWLIDLPMILACFT